MTMMTSQEAMAEALAELEVHNISTAPKFGISLSSLQGAADSEEACTQLYEQMKEAVGEPYSCEHLTKMKPHLCGSGLCQHPSSSPQPYHSVTSNSGRMAGVAAVAHHAWS